MKRSNIKAIFSVPMLICITTGFSSGMPLYVLIQLIPAWLTDVGVDLKLVGAVALTQLPYSWKFLWAPAADAFGTPLGRRRGWAALSQLALMLALFALAAVDPVNQFDRVLVLASIIAFASATQDIVLDAVRREILEDHELGLGNALFVNAYRLSSLVPGSLALILADRMPWATVHMIVGAFMGVGLVTSLLMREPKVVVDSGPKVSSIWKPITEFFRTKGPQKALLILAFMLLYKLGDSMATALATPFYLELGFTKTAVGSVAKGAALWSSIVGAFLGGIVMLRTGVNRSLYLFGVVQLVSILGFAFLAWYGPDKSVLFAVVSFEYLGVGLGTAAFVAFIASQTDRRYSATQLALLTSLTSLPRTLAGSATGVMAERLGWTAFFLVCTAIALPGLLMLPWVAPWTEESKPVA